MLYLLDANALITAHNTYYAQHRVPEFWGWLEHHGQAGTVKLPAEIYAEVEDGNDALATWMKLGTMRAALRFAEQVDGAHVSAVLGHYGAALTDAQLITILAKIPS